MEKVYVVHNKEKPHKNLYVSWGGAKRHYPVAVEAVLFRSSLELSILMNLNNNNTTKSPVSNIHRFYP